MNSFTFTLSLERGEAGGGINLEVFGMDDGTGRHTRDSSSNHEPASNGVLGISCAFKLPPSNCLIAIPKLRV